ncbi:UDP-2,3-diacylglucosamine diphosphatase LpxI [Mesorhizobium sp. CN5-321]|uniref:LpxI family protein n=1 Tax=Mesorhizobium hunchu TaxID=3157708 RepID=UPI0032B6FFB4
MTRTDKAPRFQFPAGSRVGIVAGGGALPVEVANCLSEQGLNPFVLIVAGESSPDSGLDRFDHDVLTLEELGSLVATLKRHRVTHVVLAGEIRRRPRLAAMRISLGLLAIVPTVVAALAKGDDGLLRVVIRGLETRGFTVVGAHQLVPDLVAGEGPLTRKAPAASDKANLDAAYAAAKAIGGLDIGQGAVAIGGRVIALEGIEGTNGMLERVKDLRQHGRLAGKAGGVLVKCAKPRQEMRADMPTIGPQTVELAHAAGLSGVGIEAGRSLVMDGPDMVSLADRLGLFVVGLEARDDHG